MKNWLYLAISVLWLGQVSIDAQTVSDDQVDAAVIRMGEWLLSEQGADGSWERGLSEVNDPKLPEYGQTAVVIYSLLSAGYSYQDPAISKGLEFLSTGDPSGVYAASMCAHVYASLPDEFRPRLERTGQWLLKAHWRGHYDYGAPPRERSGAKNPEIKVNTSLSRTQYGVLGVWELIKRGGEIDERFWKDQRRAMIATQDPSGGWNYGPRTQRASTPPDGGMTAAGIMIQLVAQQQLDRDRDTPDAKAVESIRRGFDWLDQNYEGLPITRRDETWTAMYWYGLERIGLAAGISRINGRDWYIDGVNHILSREKDGVVKAHSSSGPYFNDTLETAFSLMFLARGRVPLWASKLELPGAASNNRPNDLYFLTDFLSDQREAELNWQIVSIDDTPESWLKSPLLYWSGNDRVELTPEQKAKLKRYLDLGGTLMLNSEGRGTKFRRSVEESIQSMYPRYSFEPVDNEHAFQSLITQVRGTPQFRTLNNGVRDLVVVPRQDWGMVFQSEEPGKGREWDLMTNVYAAITDRGELRNRLDPPLPARDEAKKSAGEIAVVRASYDGNWDAEPLAWEVAGIALFNQSGFELNVSEQPLESLDKLEMSPPLVHLSGTEAVEFGDAELAAVKGYVESGGTVLLETVGGLGTFADEAASQLVEALGGERRWLDATHPIVTGGEGVADGADASRITYRGYTQLQGSAGDAPTLAAIFVGDRPAVIVSPRDLSIGALGSRHYKVNGYAAESARTILNNIVLWSAQPTP